LWYWSFDKKGKFKMESGYDGRPGNLINYFFLDTASKENIRVGHQ